MLEIGQFFRITPWYVDYRNFAHFDVNLASQRAEFNSLQTYIYCMKK